MTEVISVRFRGGCKNYYFNPNGNQVKMGDQVIVETAQGPEFATCTEGNHEVEDSAIVKPLSPMLRMATDSDRRTVEQNKKRESEAFDICEKKIAAHGLEMKLVNVSASFDGNKIVFYFTADGRVDFRELVRDLAGVFRARIELRQIGVRDEAKMIGGLGICGRPFCCSQFLDGFLPVSIKMAKTQNLSLNPTKISGTCGRLMCCLKYEQNVYEDAAKRMPKAESFVQTPDGPGNVKSVDLLQQPQEGLVGIFVLLQQGGVKGQVVGGAAGHQHLAVSVGNVAPGGLHGLRPGDAADGAGVVIVVIVHLRVVQDPDVDRSHNEKQGCQNIQAQMMGFLMVHRQPPSQSSRWVRRNTAENSNTTGTTSRMETQTSRRKTWAPAAQAAFPPAHSTTQ